ncbi:hypothetical protein [Ensifer soli]|uniref:hypothetical protein n=1 Tax=Ciceribacter sp. sgz301302 TaxID=3342379 RepID=UPI0035B75B1D
MLYWLPRIAAALFGLVLASGILAPLTMAGMAAALIVVVCGLALLSVTLKIFPPSEL